jgi:transglutaminase-like putative cysteine protease
MAPRHASRRGAYTVTAPTLPPPAPPTGPTTAGAAGTNTGSGAGSPTDGSGQPQQQTLSSRFRSNNWLRAIVLDATFWPTIAATALTLAVGLGFGRLFSNGSFVGPIVVAVVVTHGVAFWCRRNDLPTPAAAIASLGATGVTAAWTILGHTTAYGIPLPYTLRVAVDELGLAREAFQLVKAPTSVTAGFLIALVLALGVAAFMTDWAAFRLHTPIEALVPPLTLFVFTSALADGRSRAFAVIVFVTCALTFIAVHGSSARGRIAWFGGRAASGRGLLARSGAIIGGSALLLGLIVGPVLPGASQTPLLRYKNRGIPGPTSRSTVSPLVDIRGRLVEQSDVEVFTVESGSKAYWRLTSLDTFNGKIWQSNTKYRPTKGSLGTDEPLVSQVPSTRTHQVFRVRALASIWLPAAFRPQEVRGINSVSYNADTASLITDSPTTDGYSYTIDSAVPSLTPAQLQTAPAEAPADIANRYLQLPSIPARVVSEAHRVVRNAHTPYEQAKALQDYFRSGRFTYDLNVVPGHDESAIERFLFTTRRGYCEQFAGVYAVLARAVGLPARVAVGFTPGDPQAGVFHVRDRNAHAWPEVYLHGFGWVAFEPTPGRGAPGSESYTGVREAQDTSGTSATNTTAAAPTTTAPHDATPSTVAPSGNRNVQTGKGSTSTSQGPSAAAWWFLSILLLALAYCTIVPLVLWRAGHRRARGAGGREAVVIAWTRTTTVLAQAGVRKRSAETVTEFAARAIGAARLQPEPAGAMRTLGAEMATACYSGDEPPPEAGARAASSATVVINAVTDQVKTLERLRWWLDIRRAFAAVRRPQSAV